MRSYKRLIPGICYIVTKGSDDETFREGDKLFCRPNGSIVICNIDAVIPSKVVKEAIEGAEFKMDKDRIDSKRRYLLERLAELDAAIKEAEE